MVKIAVFSKYKMVLPFYGKFNGMNGYFTSEGFIYAFTDDNEGVTSQEIEPIEYSSVINCEEKDVEFTYNSLNYAEY